MIGKNQIVVNVFRSVCCYFVPPLGYGAHHHNEMMWSWVLSDQMGSFLITCWKLES